MKLKPAHARLEVVPTLEALARTLLTVLDGLSSAGEERDDRPRQFAMACARWARDEATPSELGAAVKAVEDEVAKRARDVVAPEQRAWTQALKSASSLARWRADMMKYPTHTKWALHQICADLALTLMATGEARDAAGARVEGTFAQHFTAITGHAPTAIGLASLLANMRPEL